LVLKVVTDRVAATVTEIRRLPWVTAVSVPGDNITQMGRRIGTSARRRTAVIPWEIHDSHADLVGSILGNTGSGAHIAFIDGGADCTHVDLSARVVGGKDYTADSLGFCTDLNGHGTAVAGVLAASGTDLRGMAPSAKLYSYRVCSPGCNQGDIALAIRWAKTHDGINVINISLGDCGLPHVTADTAISNAIAEVVSAGIIVVAAAGDGALQGCASPQGVSTIATASGAIAVAGFRDTTYASSSSYFTYGSSILLSAAGAFTLADKNGGGTQSNWAGSSFSAPAVAGTAGLMRTQGLSYINVLALLEQEAHPRGTGHPNNYYGYGSVDALASVAPTPQVFSFTSTKCHSNIIYFSFNPCDVQPVVSYGLTPFKIYWHFQYTSSMHADIYDTTSTASETFPIPDPGHSASYSISLTVTVSDTVSGRTRTSTAANDGWVVCPDSTFLRSRIGSIGSQPGGTTRPTIGSAPKPSFQNGPPPPRICP
jgi:subtilisin family serine protease